MPSSAYVAKGGTIVVPNDRKFNHAINRVYDATVLRTENLSDRVIYAIRPGVLAVLNPVYDQLTKLGGLVENAVLALRKPMNAVLGPVWYATFGLIDGEWSLRDLIPTAPEKVAVKK